ncbi:MAG TPA: hypothetical protein VMV81_04075, partial [Phycisphaerae bacterium]|nr:hypothetical protein [Phycisphaerae bacterium]
GIEIGPAGIRMSLGPSGDRTYTWPQLRFRLDEAVDWDMLEMMPDDAFVPGIIDRATGEDLGPKIVKFTGISHEEFTRHLRPFLRHPPCPTG